MSDKTLKQKQQAQDKERQAYAFYTSQGWKPHQAIGIIGNLKRESEFDSNAVGDGGKAFGLAQWHPDRQAKAKQLYGENWKSFENQLKFVDWELNNTEKAAGDKLRVSKGVWEAGAVVSDYYERPKVKFAVDETRQRHVSDLAMKFKGIKLTPEDMPYYGATFANSVAPYMNPQYTPDANQPTSNVTFLQIPQQTPTFASAPTPEKEEDRETDVEVQKVEQESNFLREIEKEDYAHLQPQQKIQEETPQTDYMQQYEQIGQFLGSGNEVAQQGGQKYTENELAFLSEIAIKDQEGQRNHPNKVIEIQGNTMSTNGYGDIPLFVIPNKGKARVIEANTGQHKFKGATKFLEIPIKNA